MKGYERFMMRGLVAICALVVLPRSASATLGKDQTIKADGAPCLTGKEGEEQEPVQLKDADYYNDQGHTYIRQGKIDEAVDMFILAIKAAPSSSLGYRNLGWCLYKLGRYKDSNLVYEKALKLDPYDVMSGWSYGGMGQNYIYLQEYENARSALEKAVARLSYLDWAHDNLGVAYYHLGEYEKAYQAAGKSLELSPNDPYYHYNRGLACVKLGKSDEAIDHFRKAISLGVPHRADAYHSLILTYQEIGDQEGAGSAYRELQEIDPDAARRLQFLIPPGPAPHPSV